MDNDNWISIHAYVMQNWVKVRMLIFLQKVLVDHGLIILIVVIMETLQKGGGLNYVFIV